MSEEYWERLGRRAVACKAWRWMPGMCHNASRDDRVLAVEVYGQNDGYIRVTRNQEFINDWDVGPSHGPFHGVPDFSDPATLGCLLALVREAWCDDGIATMRAYAPDMAGQWSVYTYRGGRCLPRKRQATEAAALVAALEAAP